MSRLTLIFVFRFALMLVLRFALTLALRFALTFAFRLALTFAVRLAPALPARLALRTLPRSGPAMSWGPSTARVPAATIRGHARRGDSVVQVVMSYSFQ